ncbi:hypothetical protein CPB97_006912 [Podila verticillata]|nr:hypothetical protein CPB97_006912 [Podila verticillata]
MKLTIAAALALCAPSLAFALVGCDWKFNSAPSGGLNDITFPFNIANAPHKTGYFFAQQFSFQGISDVGYIGLQPRPDSNGKSIIHAVFSSFQRGTTSIHPNCHEGADGGPGVSCAVDIIGDYSHTYNMVVENIQGTLTWRGSLVDTATGASTTVGQWTLPAGAGKLINRQVGFVEYYPWNDGRSHPCSTLPKTEVTFDNPTSKTAGASGGVVSTPYEYGDCVGQVGFSTTKVTEGYDIIVGI